MPKSVLSQTEAFAAMVHFLEAHLERTGSQDIAGLLGDLAMRPDGTTADAAAWQDWLTAVARVKD
jgi:hypothetical protein